MKQQIIVSGTGGQGVLFLTRFFAEAALESGHDVLTSEIHGMAMRGGTVVSHVKVGAFKSPLIRWGHADAGLLLTAGNLALHGGFVREEGRLFINTAARGGRESIDASALATEMGAPSLTNVILLGFAIGSRSLFCDEETGIKVIKRISGPDQFERNVRAFEMGLARAGQS
jgi:indolepyruvate ferredoxin oxidoreductase, beta subunit